jgi:Uma2 family endonuclease
MSRHITPEQYLELDRKAQFKSEYYLGELTPVASPAWAHSIVVANVVREFSNQLRGRADALCVTGVGIRANNTVLVPDCLVVCGPPTFADERQETLLNPTVVVEVSTPATAVADGGRRFDFYGALPSVREYVWIVTDRIDARVFTRRTEREWLMAMAHELEDALTMGSIGCGLRLSDLYDKLEFSDADVGVGYMRPLQS